MSDSKKYTSKLTSTRILVIGGSSGIGFCVAEACLEFGATVIVSSSNQSRIDSSIGKLLETYPSAKGRISGYACDLSTSKLEANIQNLLEQCGDKLDHIVFTAGDKLAITKLEDASLEYIQNAGMVRFYAPLLVAKHAVKHLNPGPASSITLTTGSVSERPNKHWAIPGSYATGLHGMMRGLALDLAPIRVNLISPGAVMTPLWDGLSPDQVEGFMKTIAAKCTTAQVGNPEDVAESYL